MRYFIGDIHGQYDTLARLLREANLVSQNMAWSGGQAELWFMGDFVDRGPDGIGAIELVMRLQQEAAAQGGFVGALLGNHDVLLLAAQRLGQQATTGPGGTFEADWLRNGGVRADMERLRPEHVAWLANLPALAHSGETLLAHADAGFYTRYGNTIDDVNTALPGVLHSDDPAAWDRLLDEFSERLTFSQRGGEAVLAEFLGMFGGSRLIHGHTPISYMTGSEPADVTGPHIYAGGRGVNIDGGLYLGGRGFVFQA